MAARSLEGGRHLLGGPALDGRVIPAEPAGGLAHPRPCLGIAPPGFRRVLVPAQRIAQSSMDARPVIANALHAPGDIQDRAALATDDILDWETNP